MSVVFLWTQVRVGRSGRPELFDKLKSQKQNGAAGDRGGLLGGQGFCPRTLVRFFKTPEGGLAKRRLVAEDEAKDGGL